MNLAVDPERFRRELAGWTARMILCALPSAGLAALEFHRPFELAAMATGVALFIGGATWFSAWDAMQETPGRQQFVRSLKMVAWIKALLLLLAATGLGLAGGLNIEPGAGLMLGLLPDVFAGFSSLWLVGHLAGNQSFDHLHGFGWILAATLTQGAIISAGLGLAAGGLCAANRAWAWFAHRSSPARIWG